MDEELRKQKAREYARKYRQENKEKVRKCIDDWRNKNRDKVNENSRQYKENNKEKVKEWNNKYYARNIEKIKAQNKLDYQQNRKYYDSKRREYMIVLIKWVDDMKKEKGCRICKTLEKLEYHHIKPEDKFMEISTMVNAMMNREDILEEIKKCEVLCNGCHIETHNIIGRKRRT